MKIFKFLISIIAVLFLVVGCQSQATQVPALTDTPMLEPTLTIAPKTTNTSTQVIVTPPLQTPFITATTQDCTKGWTQLKAGLYAQVAGAENDPPNRVRSEPVKGENTIAQIYPGDVVKVIEGPICADGLVFWKVENTTIPNGVGWTAEGDKLDFWLKPYSYMPDSVQLSAYGVSISVPGNWSNVPDSESVGNGSDTWCKWPEHIKIVLTTYPAKSEWKPEIFVWVTKDMPDWYPPCFGAPLLRIHQKMLSLGSRVLIGSKNAQPIFNSELIYVYNGQTSDGKYSINAFMPVNYPLLAYSFRDLKLPPGGIPFNLENQNWETYYQQVGTQLEGALDSDFTPNLEILDAIMESITVTRP